MWKCLDWCIVIIYDKSIHFFLLKISLSPLGNGILWVFKKHFMKLDAIIVLVSQREKKYWGSKMVARLLWNATRWPLDDAECNQKIDRIKSSDKGFLKSKSVKCGWCFCCCCCFNLKSILFYILNF